MVIIGGVAIPIPTSIGGAIGLLIDALIAFSAIVIADMFIAHEIEPKRSFIMAIIAYFLTPLVFSLVSSHLSTLIPALIIGYLIPLIVWIILGEILLEEDAKTKLKVAVIAFIVYAVLGYLGVPMIIASFIPI